MAVSGPDRLSHVHVAGFRDRLGERVILPQSSGALLEYLYFADLLSGAPFFAQTLKERAARLSTFSHASYCRVRRVQRAGEEDVRSALVSVHVPGHRLTEILQGAAWAGLHPPVPAVMAAAKQAIASVSLLHDFAPDAFHGAIGPDRLILTGEGRVVIAEHVLGTVMTQAAEAWGAGRLWRELGVASMTDPALASDGRRHDIVQVGLLVLALLVGRPIAPHEYPDELLWLLQQATEAETDGTRTTLGPGLYEWLERALSIAGGRSYTTLLDAQKALADLMQVERYAPSPAAWNSYIAACETALQDMPAPGTVPAEPEPEPEPEPVPTLTAVVQDAPAGVGTRAAAEMLEAWPPESQQADRVRSTVELAQAVPAPPSVSPAPPDALLVAPAGPGAPLGATGAMPPPPPLPAVLPPAQFTPPPPPRVESAPPPTLLMDEDAGAAEIAWEPEDLPVEAASAHPEALEAPWRTARRHISPGAIVRPVVVLVLLLAVGAAAVMYAPRVWALVFDASRSSAQLIVDSEPTGSSVTVDGRFLGLTPLTATLQGGSHKLEVQNGGALQSKTIELQAGKRLAERMVFPGSQDRGGLSITTYPAAGKVIIDGIERGAAPINVADLAPGSHLIVIETPLGSQTQDVTVQAGQLLPVTLQTVSWVKVEAPYDLEVSEDGRSLGTTGKATVVVSPGRHHLEFSNASLGLKLRQAVDTEPGRLATVPLELPMGTMNLKSDQPAEVSVDGQYVGTTPISGFAVPLGKHEVTFQHAKLGKLVYSVTATLAGPVRLTASFKK